MPMTQAATRHRRFRFQPKKQPPRQEQELDVAAAHGLTAQQLLHSQHQKQHAPRHRQTADGAVQRPPERLGGEERVMINSTTPTAIKRSGMMLPSKSAKEQDQQDAGHAPAFESLGEIS